MIFSFTFPAVCQVSANYYNSLELFLKDDFILQIFRSDTTRGPTSHREEEKQEQDANVTNTPESPMRSTGTEPSAEDLDFFLWTECCA